ncbi:MAG: 4-hydroxy-tetrahydrodipicolinate synthase [Firmicutes bacterium]|nr:4-hydroxy-tetrahydrodipicolinate synthase [Bacillota bacterium]
MTLFHGAGVAIVTPFSNGKVDFPALGKLIDRQIEEGIDALIVCGTTGEAPTLKDEEHVETVRFAVDRAQGRVPVIGGAGSNDTHHALEMSLALEEVGVDGLLIVTPYYNKCTQKGLISHYTAIADAVDTPMILYSVPSRTGVNISPGAVEALCGHPNIAGIKEASGNISQVVEISRFVSDEFALYSGNDDMIVPTLSVGGVGVISVAANLVPGDTSRMVHKYLNGDTEGAAKLQLAMKPLIDALFCEVNPIPVKAALALMGQIQPEYRSPLCPPDPANLERIKKELEGYGLI